MEGFWARSAFRARFGDGRAWRQATSGELDALDAIDPLLAALVRADGWASYLDGFLWTAPPTVFGGALHPWVGQDPTGIVAYARTAWGHFVALGRDESELIDPLYGQDLLLPLDPVSVLDGALVVDDVVEDCWLHSLYGLTRARLPPPGPMDAYAFQPALALGGAPDPERVVVSDLLATLHLLMQLRPPPEDG